MPTEVKAQNTTTLASVKAIYEAAEQANGLLDNMQEAAEAADTTLDGIYQDAADAKIAAGSAQTSSSLALSQLDIIENLVGVLDLLSKNGTYELTDDTEVQPNKWYFVQTGSSPDYAYQVISNPTGDPSAQGWYELTGIDQAVQHYVSSHLVLENNGLWLQTDGSTAKLFLSSTDGVVLYGTNGTPVAKYGTDTLIGNYVSDDGFYIKLDSVNNEIGFYNGLNKVAYMNTARLYVANSLSFGNFIFYQRDNGHFTLKRID